MALFTSTRRGNRVIRSQLQRDPWRSVREIIRAHAERRQAIVYEELLEELR